MKWALTLDPPLSLSYRPALIRSVHASDFAVYDAVVTDTWRDPVTRLLMLRPTWLSPSYGAGMVPRTSMRVQDTNMWADVYRGAYPAAMFALLHPDGWSVSDIALADVATYLPVAGSDPSDTLVWALQSSGWWLSADEGFVVYYHALADEFDRAANWIALQWGRLCLRIGAGGAYELYDWGPDDDMTAEPTLRSAGEIAGPGEQLSRSGFLAITPVPGLGIALHYPQVPAEAAQMPGSVDVGVPHGVAIPYMSNGQAGGPVIAEAGPLTIAVNPAMPVVLGIQRTRYPSSGTFRDGWFDTVQVYSEPPETPVVTLAPRASDVYSSVTAEILGPSGAWVPGTDHRGRVELTLATTSTTYTPFVIGYTVEFPATVVTRDTEAVSVDVSELEWTRDAEMRDEGVATIRTRDADVQTIAQRGDATARLQYSYDGVTYYTVLEGFASDWQLQAGVDGKGLEYHARFRLEDYRKRMREVAVNLATAFDWMTVAGAVDNILKASGLPPVATRSPELEEIVIPGSPTGSQWRYAPSPGDTGEDALRAILLHARRQNEEWILRYDYDSGEWATERRNRNPLQDPIAFVPSRDEADPANGVFAMDKLELRTIPPEANILMAVGATRPDNRSRAIAGPPLVNYASLDDPGDADYLGRAVLAIGVVSEAPTQAEVNLLARRMYDAAAHRRVLATVTLTDWDPRIKPNAYVTVYRNDSEPLLVGWVKRVTVRVTPGGSSRNWLSGTEVRTEGTFETVTVEVDTRWETDLE